VTVVVVPEVVSPLVTGAATVGSVFEVAMCAAMGAVELESVAGVVLSDADDVNAVVAFDAVEVASVVVAVKAATMPVLKVPRITRVIMRTLATENATMLFFIPS
jgi:hypothetical protein